MSHGVALPWPNHNNGQEHRLATLEPANETGAVLATYQPAYAVRTRKTKRPEPRTRTFPGPVDGALVKAVREWIQEQIDGDPFAQAFSQDEALAKRSRVEARAAELAEIEGREQADAAGKAEQQIPREVRDREAVHRAQQGGGRRRGDHRAGPEPRPRHRDRGGERRLQRAAARGDEALLRDLRGAGQSRRPPRGSMGSTTRT